MQNGTDDVTLCKYVVLLEVSALRLAAPKVLRFVQVTIRVLRVLPLYEYYEYQVLTIRVLRVPNAKIRVLPTGTS